MNAENTRWTREPNEARERKIKYVRAFLTAQMQARKMHPSAFARFSGISKDAISTYLHGRSAPNDAQLWKLAEVCNVSVNDIIPGYAPDDPSAMTEVIPVDCPEFFIGPAQNGQVLLHVRKTVSFDVAIEIGRIIGESRAADRR